MNGQRRVRRALAEHERLARIERGGYRLLAVEPSKRPESCVGVNGHFVRSDNPMRTGRCELCHRFVGKPLTSGGVEQSWRTMTIAQARQRGLVGARRGADVPDREPETGCLGDS